MLITCVALQDDKKKCLPHGHLQVNDTEFRPKIVAIVELYMYAFEIVFYKKRENRSVGLLVVNLMDMHQISWLVVAAHRKTSFCG